MVSNDDVVAGEYSGRGKHEPLRVRSTKTKLKAWVCRLLSSQYRSGGRLQRNKVG